MPSHLLSASLHAAVLLPSHARLLVAPWLISRRLHSRSQDDKAENPRRRAETPRRQTAGRDHKTTKAESPRRQPRAKAETTRRQTAHETTGSPKRKPKAKPQRPRTQDDEASSQAEPAVRESITPKDVVRRNAARRFGHTLHFFLESSGPIILSAVLRPTSSSCTCSGTQTGHEQI